MASSKPSFPAPSEPNLKRLGIGGGNTERPIKAQLVVLGVLVLLVVAVPMYLLRKPDTSGEGALPSAEHMRDPGLIRSQLDAGKPTANVVLGEIQRVQCSAAPGKQGNEGPLCDSLPTFEKAFQQAIRANVECAPRTGKAGTINFVLTLDFANRRANVFPGQSGQWKGPQAKAAAECVERSLPDVKWDDVPHRYRYYMLAVLATYPAPDPTTGFPEFE
jgi:hypothetical protein